jgi:hypothetical protein
MPAIASPKATLSLTVSHGTSRKDWNTNPISGPGLGGRPETRMLPWSGSTNPFTIRSSVVFPHPDGPMSATK